MRAVDTDIFNMVSLRGAGGGAAIDPLTGSSGSSVAPILRANNIDPSHASAEDLARLPAGAALQPASLSKLVSSKIAAALEKQSALDVAALGAIRDQLGGGGGAAAIGQEYDKLVDSWLVAKMKRDAPVIEAHERLIRAARLWKQFLADPRPLRERGALESFMKARVVLPRSLTTAKLSDKPRGSPQKAAVEADRARYLKLTQELALRESIQKKAYRLYWDRAAQASAQRNAQSTSARPASGKRGAIIDSLRANRAPPALDGAFFQQLNTTLTNNEKSKLQALGGAPVANKRLRIDDLIGDLLDVHGVIVEANSVCSRIRVFESEQASSLPPASAAVPSAERPSVRAIGWGDLIVARERLVDYQAREIAHIENVLPGEDKLRTHKRTRTIEQVTETTTVTEDTRERDLQTTDRHELQNQVNEVIDEKFSVKAGVNTSGRYGVTTVNTSLDAAFERSSSESRSATTQVAQEIVAKTVEKTFQSVRELRRTTITDAIREANRHRLRNLPANGNTPAPISGVYLWVEKIHEVALRHYGTRLMVEFHIPEPGLSLFAQAQASRVTVPKPAPLAIGPLDIEPTNYLCIAKAYGAVGVESPPAPFIEAGYTWRSEPSEEAEGGESEDTVAASIPIPDGYQPIAGHASITSIPTTAVPADQIYLYVAVGGREVIESIGHTRDSDWTIDRAAAWPNGVPVSMLAHGQWDKTLVLHVALRCERTPEAMTAWRIRTWEKIVEAHERLQQDYDRAVLEAASQNAALFEITGASEAVNRAVEQDEFKKWSIKTMRVETFDDALFNAVVQVGEHAEIDPVVSDAQAPIIRFFEEAFEWREMSYFLYPYFWGRRAAWDARLAISGADYRHTAFLQAGAARVIVPVTPGYEERVLYYLDSDPAMPELERIASPAPGEIPADSQNPELWLELIIEKNAELALGSGTLSVVDGNDLVTINGDSRWVPGNRDLGRDLYIGGERYQVAEPLPATNQVRLDRPYAGSTDAKAAYATGSVPFGAPWLVRIPTELVILKENVGSLGLV
jgi:hypothetical protein